LENQGAPFKKEKSNKVKDAVSTIIGLSILVGLWLAAAEIKDRFIGFVDLTGGKGGAQPAINLLITLLILAGLIFSIFGVVMGLAKVSDFFSSRSKRDPE